MILVFLAGVLWSTVGLGVRLIDEAVVWQILLYRSVSLSLFLFLVIRLRSGISPFTMARRTGRAGLVGAVGLVMAYSGGIFALQHTSVANAMLLFAVAPFATAVLGWVLLGERVRVATWIAIGFGLLGILVMVVDEFGTGSMAGNIAAFLSAMGFAFFTIALRWGRAGDMLPAVFLSGLIGFGAMLIICLVLGLPLILTPRDGGIAMIMGVAQVGAGLLLYTIGSRALPAVELTLLSLAEVVLGPVWVWLLLGERIALNTVLGGAILLAAIVGNAASGARRKPPVTLA